MPNTAPAPVHPWSDDPILADGGACGALLRGMNWRASPLGVPAEWPQELRVLVSVILGSMQPSVIVWGPEGIALYNDGFAAMMGDRHPACFARPFTEMWGARAVEIETALVAACAGGGSRLDEFVFEPTITSWQGLSGLETGGQEPDGQEPDGQQPGGLETGGREAATYAFALTPVRTPEGDVLGVCCTCVETTWQYIARRDAAAETARLREMFFSAPGAIAITAGRNHVYELTNAAFNRLLGRSDLVGHTVGEGLPPETAAYFRSLLDTVCTTGEAHVGEMVDIALAPYRPGDAPRRITLDFVLQPVREPGGKVSGVFAEFQDVTERAIAAKQQELINREIAHRMKNQLAVVNSIVTQSLRASDSIEEIKKALGARIAALARAQTALVNKLGGAQGVSDVVASFLEVHAGQGEQISSAGPDVHIGARPALSLALILHELGTNAAKYGALSTREGRVTIGWSIQTPAEGKPRFALTWRESGGPPVTPPARPSAGARLIRAGLAGALDTRVELDYAQEGVTCVISADLASLTDDQSH